MRRAGMPPHVPGFEFVEVLGTGGSADVFRYRQLGLGRDVAVKVLLGGDQAHQGFEAEATVMAQLSNHPSIVSIFQAGTTHDGRPFLVMEYCPPPHLGLRVRGRPMAPAKALEITIQLAGAVETAHRMGILHRDIKPANVLTTQFGRAALTDFGISMTTVAAASGGGMSVPWAPPEQLAEGAPMGPSSDVWSLAATAWTALAGHSPFHLSDEPNDAVSMAGRIRGRDVPPTGRRDVPETLERTLRTAMAKRAEDRFPTALSFARALQAVQVEMRLPMTTIDVIDQQVPFVHDASGGTRVTTFTPAASLAPVELNPTPWSGDSTGPPGAPPAAPWPVHAPSVSSAPPFPPPSVPPQAHHQGHQQTHQAPPAAPSRLRGPLTWLLVVLLIVGLGVAIGAGVAAVAAPVAPGTVPG